MLLLADKYILKDTFARMDRDYFSLEGCEAIIDYYDMYAEDRERIIDPDEIIGSITEYGTDCLCDWDDFIREWGYLYTYSEWLEDNDEEETESMYEEDRREAYLKALSEHVENKALILWASNGNLLICQ